MKPAPPVTSTFLVIGRPPLSTKARLAAAARQIAADLDDARQAAASLEAIPELCGVARGQSGVARYRQGAERRQSYVPTAVSAVKLRANGVRLALPELLMEPCL